MFPLVYKNIGFIIELKLEHPFEYAQIVIKDNYLNKD